MKKLLIVSIIGLLPAIIFAQAKQVNCDDLARYIEKNLAEMGRSGAHYRLPLSPLSFGKPELWVSFWETSLDGTEEKYKRRECKVAGKKNEKKAKKLLSDRAKTFEWYQNGLKECIKTSNVTSDVASKMVDDLQKKKDMCLQCIKLFEKGRIEEIKALNRVKELENFINNANKK
jgi:hypothetical protein